MWQTHPGDDMQTMNKVPYGGNSVVAVATGTDALPKSLKSKVARVLSLAHDGHTMGTIADSTQLSLFQIDRILRAAGQK
jgi:hypothetical protein